MTKEEIAEEIETKYQKNVSVIKITFKNGKTIYGGFEVFEDFDTLKLEHKYRFVPSDMRKDFNKAFRKTDQADKTYSVTLDCAEIGRIQYV